MPVKRNSPHERRKNRNTGISEVGAEVDSTNPDLPKLKWPYLTPKFFARRVKSKTADGRTTKHTIEIEGLAQRQEDLEIIDSHLQGHGYFLVKDRKGKFTRIVGSKHHDFSRPEHMREAWRVLQYVDGRNKNATRKRMEGK